ncbi:MAG: helix-turn-helix domain-containing protein [Candidatus Omnitrophica bacterium]|nr:helix-turn-helix domain-containing protein [Candidatus Omnitrophota bacterium]
MDVKTLRSTYKVTREDIASKLGVSYKTVERWETGEVKPRKVIQMALTTLDRQLDKQSRGV